MDFRTLDKIPTDELVEVFNRSFEGYFVPVKIDSEGLAAKMQADRADLSISVGAFDNDRLVGFMIHGADIINGRQTFYNAGTGVLPEFRGQSLTVRMHRFILPHLKEKGFERGLLEVITENIHAIKSYEQAGFNICRELDCYGGNLLSSQPSIENFMEVCSQDQWNICRSMRDWQQAWQNMLDADSFAARNVSTIIYYRKKIPAAYAMFRNGSGNVMQIAVHPHFRRQGIGKELLQFISTRASGKLSMLNVDSSCESTRHLLNSAGLDVFIQQYEMEIVL